MPDSPSAWLRSLAAEATPGPWSHVVEAGDEWWFGDGDQAVVVPQTDAKRFPDFVSVLGGDTPEEIATARLIALAPDLAVLCADAIDALEFYGEASNYRGSSADVGERRGPSRVQREKGERARDVLARFAALQPKEPT